jgi:hypothetical protein
VLFVGVEVRSVVATKRVDIRVGVGFELFPKGRIGRTNGFHTQTGRLCP